MYMLLAWLHSGISSGLTAVSKHCAVSIIDDSEQQVNPAHVHAKGDSVCLADLDSGMHLSCGMLSVVRPCRDIVSI